MADWTEEEKGAFLEGLVEHGKDYAKIATNHVTSQSLDSVRKYGEGFFAQFNGCRGKGAWTYAEEEAFIRGRKVFTNQWNKVAISVPTRDKFQCKSHAQKWAIRNQRRLNSSGEQESQTSNNTKLNAVVAKAVREEVRKEKESDDGSDSDTPIAVMASKKKSTGTPKAEVVESKTEISQRRQDGSAQKQQGAGKPKKAKNGSTDKPKGAIPPKKVTSCTTDEELTDGTATEIQGEPRPSDAVKSGDGFDAKLEQLSRKRKHGEADLSANDNKVAKIKSEETLEDTKSMQNESSEAGTSQEGGLESPRSRRASSRGQLKEVQRYIMLQQQSKSSSSGAENAEGLLDLPSLPGYTSTPAEAPQLVSPTKNPIVEATAEATTASQPKVRKKRPGRPIKKIASKSWSLEFFELALFKNQHGHANPSGGHLANWVDHQRKLIRQGSNHPSSLQVQLLRGVGCKGFEDRDEEESTPVVEQQEVTTATAPKTNSGHNNKESQRQRWQERFLQLKRYKGFYGHANPPQTEKVGEYEFKLASWVHSQRRKFRKGTMSPDQAEKLSALGCDGFD